MRRHRPTWRHPIGQTFLFACEPTDKQECLSHSDRVSAGGGAPGTSSRSTGSGAGATLTISVPSNRNIIRKPARTFHSARSIIVGSRNKSNKNGRKTQLTIGPTIGPTSTIFSPGVVRTDLADPFRASQPPRDVADRRHYSRYAHPPPLYAHRTGAAFARSTMLLPHTRK